MKSNIVYINYQTYLKEAKEIEDFIQDDFVLEPSIEYGNPKFGEIWICKVPVLVVKNQEIFFQCQNRPMVVLDDGNEYFVKGDHRNYYGLKITSQKDVYHRIFLSNYQELGLQKESYIRMELPLKMERNQFLYKIGKISLNDMMKYLNQIKEYIQEKIP